MITSIGLDQPTSLATASGRVEVSPPETVSVVNDNGVGSSIAAPGLRGSGWLEVWCDAGWCCLVGLKDTRVIVAAPGEGRIEIMGELDRLDVGDRYDPGGLEFVEFSALAGGDVLVVYEQGVARVSPAGMVWQRAHYDLSARVFELTPDVVWFRAEADDRFGFRLDDGTDVFANAC